MVEETKYRRMARVHENIEKVFGSACSEDVILTAFQLDHSDYMSRPYVSAENAGVLVHGEFFTRSTDCSRAGQFERYFYRTTTDLVAHHRRIEVYEPYRRQKIARKHLTKLIRFYDWVGVEYVILEAIDFGPVVWPQLGFDIRDDVVMKHARRNLRIIVEELGYDAIDVARAPALALVPQIEGQPVGLIALKRTYEELNEQPIHMIMDLRDPQTRLFLNYQGILEPEQ
jgi:hypothetical protein